MLQRPCLPSNRMHFSHSVGLCSSNHGPQHLGHVQPVLLSTDGLKQFHSCAGARGVGEGMGLGGGVSFGVGLGAILGVGLKVDVGMGGGVWGVWCEGGGGGGGGGGVFDDDGVCVVGVRP
jgi:hypothetical protein